MKRAFFWGLLFGLVALAQAQDNRLSTLATVGVSTPILDNGVGFHVGLNPSIRLAPIVAVEGQISYLYTHIGSSFLSGNEGVVHAVNTLAGGRLYLNGPGKRHRFFLNLLLGATYAQEVENGVEKPGAWMLGFSGGGYVALRRLTLGLSYDTPQNLVLKGGYAF